MWFALQDTKPFIVTLQPDAAKSTTLKDLFVGAIGITGLLLLAALLAGAVLAFILVRWHKRHPPEDDHLPSVSPPTPIASSRSSSQAQ